MDSPESERLGGRMEDRAARPDVPGPNVRERSARPLRDAGWLPPLAIGVASAVSFLGHNAGELAVSDAWLPLALAVAVSMLLWGIARLLMREPVRASVLASVAVALFFSAGLLADAVPRTVAWVGTLVVLVGAFVLLKRGESTPTGLFRVVEVAALAFFASTLVVASISVAGAVSPVQDETVQAADADSDSTDAVDTEAGYDTAPDIYYLVLDGYGREDVLEDAGGFSNREFVEGLEERGFYVASDAVSNYAVTQMALASTLNMDYLPELLPETDAYGRAQFRPLIESPRIVEELAARGYEYVHVDSGWGYTSGPDTADVVLRPSPQRYVVLEFLRTTLLEPWVDGFTAVDKRAHVHETFELLAGIGEAHDRPRFVFAHMLVPHRPYVFGPKGEEVSSEQWDTMAGRGDIAGLDAYVDQLLYTNTLVEGLLDEITADRDRPLVVLIQADHGIRSRRPEDIELADEQIVRERHAILSAYYFSEGEPGALYPAISSVNSFRVVLNEALGTDYDLLPDRSYYSDHLLDGEQPWGRIHEVTDVVTEGD
jgi:hypothetical protein